MNSTGHYSNSPNSQQCQCSVWCAKPYTRIPASQCYTCFSRSYISCGWARLDRCLQMGQLTFIIIMLWFAAVHAFDRIDTKLFHATCSWNHSIMEQSALAMRVNWNSSAQNCHSIFATLPEQLYKMTYRLHHQGSVNGSGADLWRVHQRVSGWTLPQIASLWIITSGTTQIENLSDK